MSDLIGFLRARLDEDERIAKTAFFTQWTNRDTGEIEILSHWEDAHWVEIDSEQLDHVQNWRPFRVLADVKSKRRIIDRYVSLREGQQLGLRYMWQSLVDLAQPYADHEDFREEWQL